MRTTIFDQYGLRIVESEDGLIAEYDSGESAGSHLQVKAISPSQAERAMKSEHEAYLVILELEGPHNL